MVAVAVRKSERRAFITLRCPCTQKYRCNLHLGPRNHRSICVNIIPPDFRISVTLYRLRLLGCVASKLEFITVKLASHLPGKIGTRSRNRRTATA